MSYELEASYGKQSVPVFKIRKQGKHHDVVDLMVQILLEGDVKNSWLTGDNRQILPTETQKNTCYVNSLNQEYDCAEDYGVGLALDILERHKHIMVVNLDITERPWQRAVVQGKPHNHVFLKPKDPWKMRTTLRVPRNGPTKVTSGVSDLCIMKTTQSGFENFIVDKYTTLQPVGPGSQNSDRIQCTEMTAHWVFGQPPKDGYKVTNKGVLDILVEEWSGPPEEGIYSASVQVTAYRMATKVLEKYQCIDEVCIFTPNIHHYRSELETFGLQNANVVFQSTDCNTTASGLIKTLVKRSSSRL